VHLTVLHQVLPQGLYLYFSQDLKYVIRNAKQEGRLVG
jgi:hypothetical protein